MESEILNMYNDVMLGKILEQHREMEELAENKATADQNPEAGGADGSKNKE